MRILTLAAVLLAFVTPATAAAPILSGTYILTIVGTCQPTLTADFVSVSGGQRVDSVSIGTAVDGQQTYKAKFDPSTNKVRITAGYIDLMSPLVLTKTGTQSGTTGMVPTETAVTTPYTSDYTNTATTVKVWATPCMRCTGRSMGPVLRMWSPSSGLAAPGAPA